MVFNESIGIMECARLVVTETSKISTTPVYIITAYAVFLFVLSMWAVYDLYILQKFVKHKSLQKDFVLWQFERNKKRKEE